MIKGQQLADKMIIKERPEKVIGRLVPGHWKGNMIMGKDCQSAIGTLNERSTRTVILVHLKARDAASVRKAFNKSFKLYLSKTKKSLTYDNSTKWLSTSSSLKTPK